MPVDLRALDDLAEPAYPRAMLQRLEPYTIGRIRSDYLGRVSLIDFNLSRLMRAAKQRLDSERMWTVLSSDRGHLLGEHGLVGAGSFLGGALEVPVIVTPPHGAAIPPELLDGLASTVDVTATAAAIGACDPGVPLAGRSLLPLLTGSEELPDPAGGNLSEFSDRLMLETERFKVIFDRTSRRCLGLFDLLHDPDERANLVNTPRGENLVDWRCAGAWPMR